jgi:hypothetical protein
MSKLILIALLCSTVGVSVSCKTSSPGSRTASQTLIDYYAAAQRADTATTFALCSDDRLQKLKPYAAEYFANSARYESRVHVVSERKTSDSEATVQFTDVTFDRASGKLLDSSLVECDMKREHGEWKVVICHAPYQATGGDMTLHDLNLSFDIARGHLMPADWYAGGGGRSTADMDDYSADLDEKIVHEGKYALHLAYKKGDGFGVATSFLGGLLPEVKGKTIRLGGWIKTKDVGEYAGLWWRVDGADGRPLAFNNMQDSSIRGTQDWKHYSFELPVRNDAVNVNFGVLMSGHGEAWFDGLTIDTNGSIWKR